MAIGTPSTNLNPPAIGQAKSLLEAYAGNSTNYNAIIDELIDHEREDLIEALFNGTGTPTTNLNKKVASKQLFQNQVVTNIDFEINKLLKIWATSPA